MTTTTVELPLTFEYMRDLVDRMTCQPGQSMVLEYNAMQDYSYLTVKEERQSSRGPGTAMVVLTAAIRSPIFTRESFLDQVRAALHLFATHEMDEWFAVDGLLVSGPHGEEPGTVRVHQPQMEYAVPVFRTHHAQFKGIKEVMR